MKNARAVAWMVLAAGSMTSLGSAGVEPFSVGRDSSGFEQPAPISGIATIAAQQLARASVIDLREQGDPGPDDHKLAVMLLTDAIKLNPADGSVLRLAIEAAEEAGKPQLVMDLYRKLALLEPADTSVQIGLIRARVAIAGSVEERLKVLEALLGERGAQLDPAVRSRVAIEVALLRKERGDLEGVKSAASQAVMLDPSNPSAASLALDLFLAGGGSGEGKFELLTNLLLTSPMDPSIHASIASELASAGATEQAVRFYDNAERLNKRRVTALTPEENKTLLRQHASRMIQRWRLEGPTVVVKELNDAVDEPRRKLQIEIDLARANGADTTPFGDPSTIRLDLILERIRVAAAFAAGDRSTLLRSLLDYDASVAALKNDDPDAKGALIESAYLRAWTNSGGINDLLAKMRGRSGFDAEAVARLEAWNKYRNGDRASARKAWEAAPNDLLAKLALVSVDVEGLPVGTAGQAQISLNERLAALANEAPGSPVSAWAYGVYVARNGGQRPAITAKAERYAAMGAGIPPWLDEITQSPAKLLPIKAEPARTSIGPLDPAIVNIRVTNNTPVPLSVGSDRAIDDRALVVTYVDIGGRRQPDMTHGEVLLVGRRARLMPREEVVVPVWIDIGRGGWMVQNGLSRAARIQATVVQGFVINDGVPVPGPFGTSIQSGAMARASVPLEDPARLTSELMSLQDRDFAVALLQARLQLLNRERPLTVEQAKSMMSAICDRYRKGTSADRVTILTLMPGPRMAGAVIELEQTAAQIDEADPLVARAALLTRVDDKSSPLLAKLKTHPDAGVTESARIIDARLAKDGSGFAKLGGAAPAKP